MEMEQNILKESNTNQNIKRCKKVKAGDFFLVTFGVVFALIGVVGFFTFLPKIQGDLINLLWTGLSALLIGISVYFLKEALDV